MQTLHTNNTSNSWGEEPTQYDHNSSPLRSFWENHKAAILLLAVPLLFILFIFILTPPVWKLKSGGPVTVKRWLTKKGEVEAKVGPKQADWISIKTVSKHVLNAVIVAEDARFYQHGGFDFTEIVNSAALNLKKGRYVRGGSTITQQVVKMAFLTREKSLLRKGREAMGAFAIERVLKKDQILEWYINLAEFGDGVYGLKAAAKHYYNTKPELLTIEQGANLALVLPSPNSWSKGLRNRRLTPFGHRRYAKIITAMRMGGYITETLWLHALATGDFGRPVAAYEQALARTQKPAELEKVLERGIEALPEETLESDTEYKTDMRQQQQQQQPAVVNQPAPAASAPTATPENVETEEPKDTTDDLPPQINIEELPGDHKFMDDSP